jgi:hypothetical protein
MSQRRKPEPVGGVSAVSTEIDNHGTNVAAVNNQGQGGSRSGLYLGEFAKFSNEAVLSNVVTPSDWNDNSTKVLTTFYLDSLDTDGYGVEFPEGGFLRTGANLWASFVGRTANTQTINFVFSANGREYETEGSEVFDQTFTLEEENFGRTLAGFNSPEYYGGQTVLPAYITSGFKFGVRAQSLFGSPPGTLPSTLTIRANVKVEHFVEKGYVE